MSEPEKPQTAEDTRWPSDSEPLSAPEATRDRVKKLRDVAMWRTLLMVAAHRPIKTNALAKHTRLSYRDTLDNLLALRDLEFVEREVTPGVQDRWALWQVIPGSFNPTELSASDLPADQDVWLQWFGIMVQHQWMAIGDFKRDWKKYPSPVRRAAVSQERILVAMLPGDAQELDDEVSALMDRWHQRALRNLEEARQNGTPATELNPVYLFVHAIPLERPSGDH